MLSRASTLSRPLVTAVFIPSVGKCSSVTDGSGSSTNNDEQNQSADICLDISRMSSWHRSIYHGECPTMNKFRWQSERRNLRKRFAMYGKASDVDLSVLWPNNTELEILQYEEDNWKPKLENMIKLEKTLAMKADARMQRRIEQVETNVKNYNKVLKEYNEKREKREREMLAAKQENERKIREIQDHFGYPVDPSDPKFVALMEKKRLEERKAAKAAKKRALEEKMIAHLQSSATSIAEGTSGP